jgi:hypothetical protein
MRVTVCSVTTKVKQSPFDVSANLSGSVESSSTLTPLLGGRQWRTRVELGLARLGRNVVNAATIVRVGPSLDQASIHELRHGLREGGRGDAQMSCQGRRGQRLAPEVLEDLRFAVRERALSARMAGVTPVPDEGVAALDGADTGLHGPIIRARNRSSNRTKCRYPHPRRRFSSLR